MTLPQAFGYPPISDYALIGDGRTVALVSRDASIDWLCCPRFDSPSIFAALLDSKQGGRFRIRPTHSFETERRYVPNTNVVETTFRTTTGSVVLRDLMSISTEEEKRKHLSPDHEVLREVVGLEGSVELEVCYEPRPNYALQKPTLVQQGALGFWLKDGTGSYVLTSELPLTLSDDKTVVQGTAVLRKDERRYLSLSFSQDSPAVIVPLGDAARQRVEQSISWWVEWTAQCTYSGPYREAVHRSALILKLMTYAPSGAVVAAPTTSLPEHIGGVRNWDYRYCWLRDAALTLRALIAVGYIEEGQAFFNWILHTTRITRPKLRVVYDVFGRVLPREKELSHLEGYAGSKPVRTGNGAQDQLQLDVYGEVLEGVALMAVLGWQFDRDTNGWLNGLGRTVARRWREPDEGIWEGRSGPSQNTYSKVQCWVALDRLIHLHDEGNVRVDVELFRRERDAIREAVEEHGYNERLQSYTRTFDGEDVDASLLLLPIYGYIEAVHPRMQSTYKLIYERLSHGHGLYRYSEKTDDGFPPGEGVFGICSYWGVQVRALMGDVAGAREAFDHLMTYGSDLGLFAEEFDPETGASLGNFPQAFTHVGLINAALQIGSGRGR